MDKRYIVVVDKIRQREVNEITKYFEGIGCSWWHHMGHAWILHFSENHEDVLARDLMKEIMDRVDEAHVIVLSVKSEDWSIKCFEDGHAWLMEHM